MSVQLTDEEIQKIAHLARLSHNLSLEEIQNYRQKLSPIISISKELNEVDTANLQPTDGWRTFRINNLREDEPSADDNQNLNYQRIRANIIANWTVNINPKSPKIISPKYGNLLVLPGIFVEN